jgi:hypothetical protein
MGMVGTPVEDNVRQRGDEMTGLGMWESDLWVTRERDGIFLLETSFRTWYIHPSLLRVDGQWMVSQGSRSGQAISCRHGRKKSLLSCS